MLALFLFEVKYYFKNAKEAIQLASLFICVLVLYPFSQSSDQMASSQGFAASLLWIALIMATSLGANQLFQRDKESGRLEYYQLTRIPMEWIVLAKWFAYYLSIVLPLMLIFPCAAILLNIPETLWLHYGIGLSMGAIPLSLIGALVSIFMAGLDRSGAIISLIILPLMIPVIIFGSSYTAALGEEQNMGLVFLIGFSLFMLPVLCVAGASCIKASH